MHALRNGAGMAGVLLLAAGIALAPLPAAAEATVVDAAGRSVRVSDASRILSIGGDVTEIIYALGAGNRVVGVDTTSQFPPEALKEKKSVGYMRALSSEGVISVGATLVLASERAGPPEVVKTLKTTSMPYVEVADQNSADGIVGKIRLIAKAVGTEPMGEKLVEKVIADFKALDEARAKVSRPLRALFVLGVQNGRVMVGGQNTSADAILKLAGAINVATAVNGFRPVPDEAMVRVGAGRDRRHAALQRQRCPRPVPALRPEGGAVDAGRRRQTHRCDGRPLLAGLRSARTGRGTRADGLFLSRTGGQSRQ